MWTWPAYIFSLHLTLYKPLISPWEVGVFMSILEVRELRFNFQYRENQDSMRPTAACACETAEAGFAWFERTPGCTVFVSCQCQPVRAKHQVPAFPFGGRTVDVSIFTYWSIWCGVFFFFGKEVKSPEISLTIFRWHWSIRTSWITKSWIPVGAVQLSAVVYCVVRK